MALRRLTLVIVAVTSVGACSALFSREPPRPTATYSLDDIPHIAPSDAPACHRITVSSVGSAPGYDSSRMIYSRGGHRLDHFAYHRWAERPADMLHALIMETLERSGRFSTVTTSSNAPDDLRLDTELIMLRQRFYGDGSRMEFEARARVFVGDRVIATRLFQFEEDAGGGPESGVEAANRIGARFTAEMVNWLSELAPGCG